MSVCVMGLPRELQGYYSSAEWMWLTPRSKCQEGSGCSSAKDGGFPLVSVRSHCMCRGKSWKQCRESWEVGTKRRGIQIHGSFANYFEFILQTGRVSSNTCLFYHFQFTSGEIKIVKQWPQAILSRCLPCCFAAVLTSSGLEHLFYVGSISLGLWV